MILKGLINNVVVTVDNFDLKDYVENISLLDNEDSALQESFVYYQEESTNETSSLILSPKDVWLNLEDFIYIHNEFDLKDCLFSKHIIVNNEDLAPQQSIVLSQEELANAPSLMLPPTNGWLNPKDLKDSERF